MAINDEERKKKSKALRDDDDDQSTQGEPNLNDVASSSRSINVEDGDGDGEEEEVKKSATLTSCQDKQNSSRGEMFINMIEDYKRRMRMFLDIHRRMMMCSSLSKQNVPAGSPSCSKRRRRRVVPNEPLVQPEAPIRETPEIVLQLMRRTNGRDPKLIIERKDGLTQMDVDSGQARLLIPKRQIIDMDFVNHPEHIIIDNQGLNVILVDPMGQEWTLNLKEWNMGQSRVYALVNGWNKVVAKNMFKKGYKMQLWSFYSPHILYFVIVPTQPSPS